MLKQQIGRHDVWLRGRPTWTRGPPTAVMHGARTTLEGRLLGTEATVRGMVARCAVVRATTTGLEEVTGRPVPLKGRPLVVEPERRMDQEWLSTPTA